RIDHAADHISAHRDGGHAPQPAHLAALLNVGVLAQDDHADLDIFQVEGQAERTVLELDELLAANAPQAGYASNAVPNFQHLSDAANRDCWRVALDLGFELFRQIFGDVCRHLVCQLSPSNYV